jgi:RNA polymerase sigma-54 factor
LQWSGLELQDNLAAEIADNPFLDLASSANTMDTGAEMSAKPSKPFEDGDDDSSGWEPCEAISLADHLRGQLPLAHLDDAAFEAAGYLIDAVEPSGWLPAGIGAVPDGWADKEAKERALKALRQFDPPGVFARDLADCLALQLAHHGLLDAPYRSLLARLSLVAEGRTTELARRCGVTAADLHERLARLKHLDPKPGLRFEPGSQGPEAPDLLVQRHDNRWLVRMNPELRLRLSMDQESYQSALQGRLRSGDKAFIQEAWQQARTFVDALAQRDATLLRIGAYLAQTQSDVFLRGFSVLKRDTMTAAAEKLQMDPSTVSRAVAGKTLLAPSGMLAMRRFFDHGGGQGQSQREGHSLEHREGEPSPLGKEEALHADAAPAAIQAKLEEWVAAEDPRVPLSDDALVERFQEEGVTIARRTIAKYRQAVGIASSRERRRRSKELSGA